MTASPPLVPAEVDCTDLDGFMLNVERLMASELVALSSHEVIGAALMLWCRAWKQRPAASLPNDDKIIAAFARMPLARFRKLREEVLRGFVLCSDGRLYHSTLAMEACKAYERKTAFQRKREADADRLRKWRTATHAETRSETPSETRFVAEGQGQGQGQGIEEKESAESYPQPPARAREAGPPTEANGHPPTPAGAACRAMRDAGMAETNPGDPRLLELLRQGASLDELRGVAVDAVARGRGWAWALKALEGRRADAAQIALAPQPTDAASAAGALAVEQTQRYLASQQRTPEQLAAAETARKRFFAPRGAKEAS